MQRQIEKPDKPIRVCFVSPKAYPIFDPEADGVFGGSEVDLYYLSTEIAKDKAFNVSMVVADYGQEQVCTIEGVRLIRSLNFRENVFSAAIKVYNALTRAKSDIYMIKTISTGMFLTALFCWMHKKNFTYRTANSGHCDGTYAAAHPFMNKGFILSLRNAKTIFTQTIVDRDNLKRVFGFDSIAINNGHRLSEGGSAECDTVLWVGRSADYKQPVKFIELAKQFPNQKFTMICQQATADTQYEYLRERASSLSNLQFYERVPFHEIDAFFQRAKIFVNTSDSEGFPNTFIQACKAQAAILSYNVNPDGFLDKFNCGICTDGDEEKLTKALNELLTDVRYTELGANGRKYVEEKHDITKIVDQYKKVFLRLNEN